EGKPATAASDIYALGVVLYECLSGRRPFQGDTPIATALAHLREEAAPLPDSVPAHLRDVTAAALAKDPARRIPSAGELAAALRGAPVPAVPAPAPAGDDAPTVVAAGVPGAGAAAAMAAGLHDHPDDGTRVMTTPPPGPVIPPHDDRRRRVLPAWLPWAGAALAVLVVVVLIAMLSGGDGQTPAADAGAQGSAGATASPSSSPSSSPSASPTGPVVRRADYVGQPHDQAKKALEGLGYTVQETKVANPGNQVEGTVADVSPTGVVPTGSPITLSVWDTAPKAAPAPTQHGHGHGKGKGKKK
ncbi:MAG: PASTA domain-containing protein, partial [Oryzihumus sp.]